jgi:Zn finger protein HypA/HybF involved in hydrogenase expression
VSDTDDNITKLPVRFKNPAPEERTLLRPFEVARHGQCLHDRYIVDDKKAEVECATCGERLNPMWVLAQLCSKDARIHAAQKRYAEEMERLAEREKTKCHHCGKMTRISRR